VIVSVDEPNEFERARIGDETVDQFLLPLPQQPGPVNGREAGADHGHDRPRGERASFYAPMVPLPDTPALLATALAAWECEIDEDYAGSAPYLAGYLSVLSAMWATSVGGGDVSAGQREAFQRGIADGHGRNIVGALATTAAQMKGASNTAGLMRAEGAYESLLVPLTMAESAAKVACWALLSAAAGIDRRSVDGDAGAEMSRALQELSDNIRICQDLMRIHKENCGGDEECR
jgi:hypothetical protein